MDLLPRLDLLIVGGTPAHRGGVEQFCERATTALMSVGGYRIRHLYTNGAYFRLRSIPGLIGCLARLVRHRRHTSRVWLQYVSLPDLTVLVLCRLLGYSLLVTPHLGSNWASQSRTGLRWLTRATLGLSGGIGLISPTQAEEVSLPVATPRFALRTFLPRVFALRDASVTGPMRLVHAGRLSEGKGTFLFLDVCAALHRAGCMFKAELIGSCDDTTLRRIHAVVTEHGLQDDVVVVGHVAEPEMLSRLASADVLIHLSRIDSFPLIVLESLGCGVFPICKDLPGARRMVETYCGHIVSHDDAVQDVFAILSTTPVSDLRAQARSASRHLIEDYRWEVCVAAVGRAFEAMAKPA